MRSGILTSHLFRIKRDQLINHVLPTWCVLRKKCMDISNLEKEAQQNNKNEMKQSESKRISSSILQYLNSVNPQAMNILPLTYIKLVPHRAISDLCLIDPATAKEFAQLIIDDLSENISFVAELNPGLCLLTEELLKLGIPFIHLYEGKRVFHNTLCSMQNKYPNRIDIRKENLMKIAKLLYMDICQNENQVGEALNGVARVPWEDKTNMQIIGIVPHTLFIKQLIMSVVFRTCFMLYGRPVFYLAIPPSLWHIFTYFGKDCSTYNKYCVLFQLLFNYELLGVLNRQSFLPWQPEKKLKTRRTSCLFKAHDHDIIYVIKLEPKPDIFTNNFQQKDLILFWYFLRHHMHMRHARVIPELEKWVPGCGLRLIAKDYDVFTEFGDLSPMKLLQLYKDFTSWPEFHEETFLSNMGSALLKDEDNININIENILQTEIDP